MLEVHVTAKTKIYTSERDEAVDELFEIAFSQEHDEIMSKGVIYILTNPSFPPRNE